MHDPSSQFGTVLPKHWPRGIRSALVHAISMSNVVFTVTRSQRRNSGPSRQTGSRLVPLDVDRTDWTRCNRRLFFCSEVRSPLLSVTSNSVDCVRPFQGYPVLRLSD